jgi:hypothetical protein
MHGSVGLLTQYVFVSLVGWWQSSGAISVILFPWRHRSIQNKVCSPFSTSEVIAKTIKEEEPNTKVLTHELITFTLSYLMVTPW